MEGITFLLLPVSTLQFRAPYLLGTIFAGRVRVKVRKASVIVVVMMSFI